MFVKVDYILIIIFTILSNYTIAIQIEKTGSKKRKLYYLYLCLFTNIGILIFFKYWNFIVKNIYSISDIFHFKNKIPILDIALPLGLSYYIFQTIGYIIDIYRGSQKAERNIFRFSLFTLFFPKLLVGPIERAGNFLPQLRKNIVFEKENFIEGGKRIAWGLFKKLVVADRLAIYQVAVDQSLQQQGGLTILFASLLYTLQVYADFSGYTDIAIGTARLFGFNLMENFRQPFLAKNISDFWRRWHISLSSWVNDYIFNPIAFKRREWGNLGVFYALFISFIIIGIWHGATWNYVLFGVLQAIAIVFEIISRKTRKKIAAKVHQTLYANISILLTFLYVSFSLIIFRTATLKQAFNIIGGIFSKPGNLFIDRPSTMLFILIGSAVMIMYDIQKEYNYFRLFSTEKKKLIVQPIAYALLLIYILIAGVFDGGQFIYFAF